MKLELHCHTKESSLCGYIPAEEVVKLHKEAGYDGIVITDHFNLDNLNVFSGDWKQKAESWLGGYKAALQAGKKNGLVVLFGLEARLTINDNDYLIFGATPDFVKRYADLCNYSLERLYAVCKEEQVLLVQAHPFRAGCIPADVRCLDGVEVINKNPRHDSHNDLAQALAEKYDCLIRTAGSDFHRLEDLGSAPVYTKNHIENERELYDALKAGKIHFA